MNRDGLNGTFRDRFGVQPEEIRIAVAFFAFFFLVMFPIYVNKTIKEALLITYVRPSWWPYADLVTAVLIGFVVALNARFLNRLPRRSYIISVFLFFMSHLFIFWMFLDFHEKSLYQTPIFTSGGYIWMLPVWWPLQKITVFPLAIAFSFWTDVFIATSVTHYWMVVNDAFFPHQAKRLVSFLVGGGLLGGIAGALASLILAKSIGTNNLLLVSMAALGLTAFSVQLVYREKNIIRDGPEREDLATGVEGGFLQSLKTVLRSRALRLISGLLAVSTVAATLVSFQFKTVVRASYERIDERTVMLALFLIVLLSVSAAFHFLFTDRVLKKKHGIFWALSLAPLALILMSGSLFLIGATALTGWAFLIRGSDKLLDNTCTQSGRELLYIPIPPETKYKGKILIDMFVNKAALAVGAVLLLALIHLGPFSEALNFGSSEEYTDIPALLRQVGEPLRAISLLVIGLSVIWLALSFLIRLEHRRTIFHGIKDMIVDALDEITQHDPDEAKRLADLIQSREISPTLFVMNLFSLLRKRGLSPQLKEGLESLFSEGKIPSDVEAFFKEKTDVSAIGSAASIFDIEGNVPPTGLGVQSAEEDLESTVEAILSDARYQALMESHVGAVVENPSSLEAERLVAAKLAGQLKPTPRLVQALQALLEDSSPDVRFYALESAGAHRLDELLPRVIPLLKDPATRPAAQEALMKYGPGITKELAGILSDPGEKPGIREAIPEVLAGLGTPAALDLLVSGLGQGSADLEGEIVGALSKVRLTRPDLVFSSRKVNKGVLALLRNCRKDILETAGQSGEAGATRPDLSRKAHLRIEIRRVFDLLSLIHPREEVLKAYSNLTLGTAASADSSLALLDNILEAEVKEALFPLVEDLPEEERIRRLTKIERKFEERFLQTLRSRAKAFFARS